MKDCPKKISRTQTFLKIMGSKKRMKLHQKRKKRKRNIGESKKLCIITFYRKLKNKNAWDHHSTY